MTNKDKRNPDRNVCILANKSGFPERNVRIRSNSTGLNHPGFKNKNRKEKIEKSIWADYSSLHFSNFYFLTID
jgi:hypothetical protein